MIGMMAPRIADRFTQDERDLLLHDSISTFYVDAGGVCRIEMLVTLYQENDLGADDISYQTANRLLHFQNLDMSNEIIF